MRMATFESGIDHEYMRSIGAASGGLAGASKSENKFSNSQFNKPPRTQKF